MGAGFSAGSICDANMRFTETRKLVFTGKTGALR